MICYFRPAQLAYSLPLPNVFLASSFSCRLLASQDIAYNKTVIEYLHWAREKKKTCRNKNKYKNMPECIEKIQKCINI